MAGSVLTLLTTAFLPIIGIKFAWVTIHWIAGVILTALILFHIVRSSFFQDIKTMIIWPRDIRMAFRSFNYALGRGPAPEKPGKYPFLQKVFHWGAAVIVLALVTTGCLMLLKIDTPLWRRNPYVFADSDWGIIYTIHGYSAMLTITMVMVHIYFAVRPEKLWITRSMLLGWITRREHEAHHDPKQWPAESIGGSAAGRGAAAE